MDNVDNSVNRKSMMETSQTKLFFSLFMAHQSRIYTYILMLVANGPDADDIMQETATVLWQRFKDFTPGTSFLNWALTIAHNKIMDFRKKKKHSRVHFSQEKLSLFTEKAAAAIEHVDEKVEALRHCILKLNDSDRNLLCLHYERGYTIKRVAEKANRSVPGMYKIMSRIHNQLMKCISVRLSSQDFHQ